KLHPDCHVVFQGAFYSAPHRLIGQTLWVRAAETSVVLYHEHAAIASHPRARRPGERLTHPDHLPPAKVVALMATPAWCLRRAGRPVCPSLDRLLPAGGRPMTLSHQLVPQLKQLRLSGILETLELRNRQAVDEQLSYVEFLQRLLEDEVERRAQKQLTLRLR